MPSSLRYQIEPSASPISPILRICSTSPLQNIQHLSPTRVLYFADTALEKLTSEANRRGKDLRLVVGHANVLDALMLELAEAERREDEDPRRDGQSR